MAVRQVYLKKFYTKRMSSAKRKLPLVNAHFVFVFLFSLLSENAYIKVRISLASPLISVDFCARTVAISCCCINFFVSQCAFLKSLSVDIKRMSPNVPMLAGFSPTHLQSKLVVLYT